MIIPDGYGQVNWRFTGAALPTSAEVTMGFFLGAFTGSAADAATALRIAWANTIQTRLITTCALTETLVKFGPNATGPSAVDGTVVPGSIAGATEMPNTAVLVQKVTAQGGRTGRGRFFVPGPHENFFDTAGQAVPATLALFQTECNDLHAAMNAADLAPILLHSAESPVQTPFSITSFEAQALGATQRRRLRR